MKPKIEISKEFIGEKIIYHASLKYWRGISICINKSNAKSGRIAVLRSAKSCFKKDLERILK